MRRHLRHFVPIVALALMVQIFAPIAACWAAAMAAADPLGTASICATNAATPGQPADPNGQPRAHDGACALCCLAGAVASLDPPQSAAPAVPIHMASRIVWHDQTWSVPPARAGSNAQARAPPLSS